MPRLSARSVRTFVLRQGRLTQGQQRSLDDHWVEYGIDFDDGDIDPAARDLPSNSDESISRIDLAMHFTKPQQPVWMEIGIGNGDALVYMAERNPSVNFLGVEVHLPGVGHAIGEAADRELSNVRLIRYDVVDLIEHFLMPASIARVLIYFPDPWHKTRHHKRRLVTGAFLDMLSVVLRKDGLIHFASDWVPYAEQVRSLVAQRADFECLPAGDEFSAVSGLRPETHFERRGVRLGHRVTDLVIRKISID